MKPPKVSIIILNWNGWKDTVECIDSLKKITYPNYKIIVVDNASSGDDVKILRKKFGKYIKIIKTKKNEGFAEGNNIAIRGVIKGGKSKYVLLLNNDTVVDRNFLTELVKTAESDDKIGIVGPKIYYYDEPEKIWTSGGNINMFTGKPKHIFRDYFEKKEIKKNIEFDHITGCAFFVKVDMFKKIGLLDKIYFCYLEETDFCFRVRKKGYKIVWVGKSKIWHKVSKSSTKQFNIYYLSRNRIIFMKKNARFIQKIIFYPYQIVIKSVLAFPCYLIETKSLIKAYNLSKSFWKGIVDGIENIYKS